MVGIVVAALAVAVPAPAATAEPPAPRQGPTDVDALLKDSSGNWASPRCIGDGRSGPRVQPVFVHRRGHDNRFESFATVLQRSLDLTTGVFERSSAGTRTVRWAHGPDCRPTVWQVAVPQRRTYDLVSIRRHLTRADPRFRRTDRVYALWVDSYTSPRWSGLGGDRWSATWSSSFGFVWVDAHELVHALGAVAPGAPHASGNGHCWDGRDLMCYDDGGVAWRKAVVCNRPEDRYRLDCGDDDYFAVQPRRGSWLARNPGANVANSRFLAPVAPRRLPDAPARPAGVVRTADLVSWQQQPGLRYDVGFVGRNGNLRWLAQDLVAGQQPAVGVPAERKVFVRAVNEAGVSPRAYADRSLVPANVAVRGLPGRGLP